MRGSFWFRCRRAYVVCCRRLETKLEQRLADLHVQLTTRIDRLETTVERRLAEQTRWLFGAWAALLIPIIGLWLRR